MVDKIFGKLTDEIWGKWLSVPIFLTISILIAVPTIIDILAFMSYTITEMSTIIASYNTALRVSYNIPDLIVFIESVLEKEPNRKGLLLAVVILYRNIGDEELANESLRKYIECSADCEKAGQILKRKGLYSEQRLSGQAS